MNYPHYKKGDRFLRSADGLVHVLKKEIRATGFEWTVAVPYCGRTTKIHEWLKPLNVTSEVATCVSCFVLFGNEGS